MAKVKPVIKLLFTHPMQQKGQLMKHSPRFGQHKLSILQQNSRPGSWCPSL
uniref:Uncharacterized protein n=1 Tax=Aegilops tauschii TaxID=37682 RepID=M8BHW7_AEGTA